MSDERSQSSADAMGAMLFRIVVPLLLGAVLTYLASIASAQTEQGKAIYAVQGQLGAIIQQNTDYGTRLGKVERRLDDLSSKVGANDSRLSVVEARRYK